MITSTVSNKIGCTFFKNTTFLVYSNFFFLLTAISNPVYAQKWDIEKNKIFCSRNNEGTFWAVIIGTSRDSTKITGENIEILSTDNYANFTNGYFVGIRYRASTKNEATQFLATTKKEYPDAYVKNAGQYIQGCSPNISGKGQYYWTACDSGIRFSGWRKTHSTGGDPDENSPKQWIYIKIVNDVAESKDSVLVPSEGLGETCIYRIDRMKYIVLHNYSWQGATFFNLGVIDGKCTRIDQHLTWTHDGGPESELTSLEDIDNNGTPELVTRVAESDSIIFVKQWAGNVFDSQQ